MPVSRLTLLFPYLFILYLKQWPFWFVIQSCIINTLRKNIEFHIHLSQTQTIDFFSWELNSTWSLYFGLKKVSNYYTLPRSPPPYVDSLQFICSWSIICITIIFCQKDIYNILFFRMYLSLKHQKIQTVIAFVQDLTQLWTCSWARFL